MDNLLDKNVINNMSEEEFKELQRLMKQRNNQPKKDYNTMMKTMKDKGDLIISPAYKADNLVYYNREWTNKYFDNTRLYDKILKDIISICDYSLGNYNIKEFHYFKKDENKNIPLKGRIYLDDDFTEDDFKGLIVYDEVYNKELIPNIYKRHLIYPNIEEPYRNMVNEIMDIVIKYNNILKQEVQNDG